MFCKAKKRDAAVVMSVGSMLLLMIIGIDETKRTLFAFQILVYKQSSKSTIGVKQGM